VPSTGKRRLNLVIWPRWRARVRRGSATTGRVPQDLGISLKTGRKPGSSLPPQRIWAGKPDRRGRRASRLRSHWRNLRMCRGNTQVGRRDAGVGNGRVYPPPAVVLRHGAGLQPPDVCRVHQISSRFHAAWTQTGLPLPGIGACSSTAPWQAASDRQCASIEIQGKMWHK
jgi:hypothetical protein